MAAKSRCIILGASHAAAQLAPTLRQQGWTGSISMISNEYALPYLASQLQMFKDGRRNNAMMSAMSKGLSDADIANLAAYYAGLK